MTITIIHLVAAVLASWRITELIVQDRITDKFRKRFPTYLWQCPRCVSVWAGTLCTAMFALGPLTHDWSRWSLWPFTLAWLYLVHVDWATASRITRMGHRLVIEAKGTQWSLAHNDFTPQDTQQILSQVIVAINQSQAAAPVPPVPSPAPQTQPQPNGKAQA